MSSINSISPCTAAFLTASLLLPVWFVVLVLVASAGVEDAPAEGTPIILAIVCVLAIPYGLFSGFVACPVLGRLLRVHTGRVFAYSAFVLTSSFLVVLIGSSLLGLEKLGLTDTWQIIPYLATLGFAPPCATGFAAYCSQYRTLAASLGGG